MIFKVKDSLNNMTLDEALKSMHVPKKELHWLRMSKNILINNEPARLNATISAGDIVDIPDFETESNYKPSGNNAKVIYSDNYLAVVHKPERQKTHPNGVETDTLINDVKFTLGVDYIEPIHRLDQTTSGLLLVALNPYIKKMLDFDLEERLIDRKYLARVSNEVKPQIIEARIGKKPHTTNTQQVDHKRGKRAVTHILSCTSVDDHYEITAKLETGRTHQIRVHLSHIGAPIIGDTVYEGMRSKRMELYATHIGFNHPITGDWLAFEHLPENYCIK